ncbi:hypothetical protein EHEL_060590 [Encephalitozoon hellem ATCC 50504]|nr:uncharacterized protein EHEL_060590 [Encephalitozoon hellem ATCC 50504]AFM98432.2 hypothetical protein EHEL_060590 [Encephalitozoon hellem ATCC 50504]
MKFSTVMFVALSSIVSANLFWGNSGESTSSSGFLGLGEGSSGSTGSGTSNSSSLGESTGGGNGSGSDGVQKAKEEVAGFMGKNDDTSGFFGSSSDTSASGKSGLAESESSCDEGECSGGSSNPPSGSSANFWGGKGDKDE